MRVHEVLSMLEHEGLVKINYIKLKSSVANFNFNKNREKMFTKFTEVNKEFQEFRNDLIKSSGIIKNNGDYEIAPNTEAHIKFMKDINEYLMQEVEITIPTLNVNEINDKAYKEDEQDRMLDSDDFNKLRVLFVEC